MDKKTLNNLTAMVKEILYAKEKTRDDDYLLYGFYLNKNNLSINTSFKSLYNRIKNKQIASIETISRTRRKLQELFPELRGSKYISSLRKQNETAYIEYSKQENL